ncbi:MAG: hypothetical protein M0P47_10735 [Bacteroidales bacterium]|nr:hypothetical protein [Bacteroidales bacterium]
MNSTTSKSYMIMLSTMIVMASAGMSIFLNDLMRSFATNSFSITPDAGYNLPGMQAGMQNTESTSWIRPLLMFLIMLAGMFFNQIFENLKAQKADGHTTTNVLRLFTTGWKGISFWMAIVVSPIIFYGTYYLVDALPDGNVAYFYAFQNGFFWYNIFNRFEVKSK